MDSRGDSGGGRDSPLYLVPARRGGSKSLAAGCPSPPPGQAGVAMAMSIRV